MKEAWLRRDPGSTRVNVRVGTWRPYILVRHDCENIPSIRSFSFSLLSAGSVLGGVAHKMTNWAAPAEIESEAGELHHVLC